MSDKTVKGRLKNSFQTTFCCKDNLVAYYRFHENAISLYGYHRHKLFHYNHSNFHNALTSIRYDDFGFDVSALKGRLKLLQFR
ncbi:hypothetical protein HMPREF1051_3127 [Neisseria sicca VK64]|uniref:Uncharacterized protein n=1 Tax=Neisseria sicca VK64 TaxID=1095748 RepID=I2NVF8_NEISI|nr:hypothetical protein HMPREF1051_3127 [Neisseria sicca VK64]